MDRKNGEQVLKTGQRLVRFTRWFLWLTVAAVGLFAVCMAGIVALSMEQLVPYIRLRGPLGMVNFLIGGSYLLLVLGVCDLLLYFVGIHFVGLGQLVLNTSTPVQEMEGEAPQKEEEILEEAPEEEAPEEISEEAPEALPEETPEEKEEEEDWRALLEREDALMPDTKTPEQIVDELPPPGKSGRLVSPALMNILRYSLSQEDDRALLGSLRNGITRLTKSHEQEILRYLIHIPDGNVRAATQRLYDALSQKK